MNELLLPQNMVDTVRAWPEYHELLEIVQETFVDVHHIFELFRELYWRGNAFNDGKHNRNNRQYEICAHIS